MKHLIVGSATIPLFSISSIRPARADPMAIYAAASGILSIISSFTSSNGGLQAMLNAQNQYLHVILDQLSKIQIDIANISQQIAQLQDELPQMFKDQYADELANQIAGAASQYRTILAASATDPTVFQNPAIQNSLSVIYNDAWSERTTLSQTKEGMGEKGAIISPIAAALETAATLHLNYPISFVIQNLLSYVDWFNSMLGNDEGSIPQRIASYIQAHDALIDSASQDPFNSSIGIANFKINGTQQDNDADDLCLVAGGPVSITGTTRSVVKVFNEIHSPNGYAFSDEILADMELKPNNDLGVQLISYSATLDVVSAIRPGATSIDGLPPSNGTPCIGAGQLPGVGPQAQAGTVVPAMHATSAYQSYLPRHQALQVIVDQLNLQRARIAFAARSQFVATQARQRVLETIANLSS